MDNTNLQDLAKMFDSLTKNTYQITASKQQNDEMHISIRFAESEFTHIVGLDHLDSIKRYVKNKIVLKKALYDNILKGKFNIENLTSNDIDNLEMPVSKSVNPITGRQYTLKDRLIALSDIMKYMRSPQNMLIYKNWSGKDTKINADYAIVIQSERNKDERLFLFGYADKATNKDKSINVNIYSAFFDNYSFARGKSKPFRVEKETIVDNKTKEVIFSYDRSHYDGNPKPKTIKFEIPEITPPLAVAGMGAIAAENKTVEIAIPHIPDPFRKFKKAIKNFVKKIKSAFSTKSPSKQHKTSKKSPTTQNQKSHGNKSTSQQRKAIAANAEIRQKNDPVLEKPLQKDVTSQSQPKKQATYSVSALKQRAKEIHNTPHRSPTQSKNKKQGLE